MQYQSVSADTLRAVLSMIDSPRISLARFDEDGCTSLVVLPCDKDGLPEFGDGHIIQMKNSSVEAAQ